MIFLLISSSSNQVFATSLNLTASVGQTTPLQSVFDSNGILLYKIASNGSIVSNGKNFTGWNNINATKMFQNGNQVVDQINGTDQNTTITKIGHSVAINTGSNIVATKNSVTDFNPDMVIGGIYLTGANQTVPYGTTIKSTGSISPASISISNIYSANTDIQLVSLRSFTTMTVGSGATQIYQTHPSSLISSATSLKQNAGSGSSTLSFTYGGIHQWSSVGVEIPPATIGVSPTVVSNSFFNSTGLNSASFTFTVSSGSNRILLVPITINTQSSNTPFPISVTFDNIPLKLAVTTSNGILNSASIYYLLNPPVITSKIQVNFAYQSQTISQQINLQTALESYFNVNRMGGLFMREQSSNFGETLLPSPALSGNVTQYGSSKNGTYLVSTELPVYQNNTGQNLGTSGFGIFSGMAGAVLQFFKLISGNSVCSLSTNSTNLILSCTDTNTAQLGDAGHGTSLVGPRENATKNDIKTFRCSSGVSCASNSTDVQVTNTGVTSFNGTTGAVGVQAHDRALQSAMSGNTNQVKSKTNVIIGNDTNTQRVDGHLVIYNPMLNGIDLSQTIKNVSYTAGSNDTKINVNATACGNPCILTLPSASANTNQTYFIEKVDYGVNQLMVKTAGGSIGGFANVNFTSAKDTMVVTSNGTGYTIDANEISDVSSFKYKKLLSSLRWATGAVTAFTPTTISPSTTTLNVSPFVVSKSMRVDTISIEVSTLVAGSTCRMALYYDNGTEYPSTLVPNSDVGTVSGASAGVKTNTFTKPILLQEGLYWTATQCSTATTIALRAIPFTAMPNILGTVSTMGTTVTGVGWSATNTFGAFPHGYPTAGATVTITNVPEVALRVTG